MSHFFTVVIVPGTTPPDQIGETVAQMLAPYDENLSVDPYKVYLSREEIQSMATHYQQSPQDLAGLVLHMQDWKGNRGGVDERGLYRLSTSNQKAKWDWWVVGGRWNGVIRGTPKSDETGFNFGEEYHRLEENMLPAKWLDQKLLCFALVTPDGVWHERGEMGWWAVVTNEKDEQEWDEEIIKILQQHQDCILVGVDCHI